MPAMAAGASARIAASRRNDRIELSSTRSSDLVYGSLRGSTVCRLEARSHRNTQAGGALFQWRFAIQPHDDNAHLPCTASSRGDPSLVRGGEALRSYQPVQVSCRHQQHVQVWYTRPPRQSQNGGGRLRVEVATALPVRRCGRRLVHNTRGRTRPSPSPLLLRSQARSRLRMKARRVGDQAHSGDGLRVLLRQPWRAPPVGQGLRGTVGSQAARGRLPGQSSVRLAGSHQHPPFCAERGNGRPIHSSLARVPVPRCWDPTLAPRPPVAWTECTGHGELHRLGT